MPAGCPRCAPPIGGNAEVHHLGLLPKLTFSPTLPPSDGRVGARRKRDRSDGLKKELGLAQPG